MPATSRRLSSPPSTPRKPRQLFKEMTMGSDNGRNPQLNEQSFELLKAVAGNKAALMTMDLMSDEAKLRYRSFYPCGDMLIGLRYHEPNPKGQSLQIGR